MRRGSTLTILVAFLIGMFITTATAAELTLDDCIELALKNRASIIRARGAESQAAAGQRSALGAFLPSISGSYSYSKGKETSIDPPNVIATAYDSTIVTHVVEGDTAKDFSKYPTAYQDITEQTTGPSKRWSISGSMDVFNLSNWFDYASARANKAAASLDVLASEQDLIYSVKASYYAYLASVQNVTVQEGAVKRADEQLKLIQSRFDLGSASLSDVLKQKVLYGNDRLGLLKAQNAVTNAEANLAYTIGIDPRQETRFSSEYTVRGYDGTLEDAINFSLGHNPSLLAGEKSLSSAVNGVRSAASLYLPTLGISASYSKFNGTQAFPYVQEFSSNSRTFGFSIQYNIFDGFIREQRVTNAKILRNNARANLADTRNLTVSNVKTAYLDIEQLKEQKTVSEENVAAAEEDLKITQEKYNLGAATILDLLDAQVSLKSAQVALIQAGFDLNLAIAQLENAMGKM